MWIAFEKLLRSECSRPISLCGRWAGQFDFDDSPNGFDQMRNSYANAFISLKYFLNERLN